MAVNSENIAVVDYAKGTIHTIKRVGSAIQESEILRELAVTARDIVIPRDPIVFTGSVLYTLGVTIKPEFAVLNRFYDKLAETVFGGVKDARVKSLLKLATLPVVKMLFDWGLNKVSEDEHIRKIADAVLTATVFTPQAWFYMYSAVTGNVVPPLEEKKEEQKKEAQAGS